MMNRRFLIAISLLLALASALQAEEPLRLRSCQPFSPKKGVPTRHLVSKRAADTGNRFIGQRRQLVVLAAFEDQKFLDADEQTTLEKWDRIFNEVNFREAPYCGSVHDYFMDQSYGQFDVTFDLQYVALADSGNNEGWLFRYRSTREDDENSKYLIGDLMKVLRQRDLDWSSYDWDGDGYVDQLLIVYAGKGQNDGGGTSTIWPHQYRLSWHVDSEPIAVGYGGKDYLVDNYCCVQEQGVANNSFGTICHEYSHCFGFSDFYYDNYSFIGGWDLMDYGNLNGNGYCPCGYSAWERFFMGWLHPTVLGSPTTVTSLEPLHSKPQAYQVINDGYEQEYYIVEHRQKQGWDAYLPGSGILVFHIDYADEYFINSVPNTTYHQRYSIFPACNFSIVTFADRWAYPYAGRNELTNTSLPAATLFHPNTDGQMLMSKPITQMAVNGVHASFVFMNDSTTAVQPVPSAAASQPASVLYRLGPVSVVRMADGSVRKLIKECPKL